MSSLEVFEKPVSIANTLLPFPAKVKVRLDTPVIRQFLADKKVNYLNPPLEGEEID